MCNARFINTAVAILLVCGMYSVFADNAVWPSLLSVPQADTSHHADSSSVSVGSGQTYFDKVVKSKDTVQLHKNTPAYGVDQLVNYEYNTDFTAHSNDHYFDLSGVVTRKNLPYGITAGLEWTPVLIVRKREKTSAVDATIESGPVLQFSAFGIPMKANAGGAARMWNDSLVGGVHLDEYDLMNRDKGIFAGGEFGDPSKQFLDMPLYVNIKGYGRSMATSKLIAATGSALWYYPAYNHDTLFASYTDSLINGRDAVLGQASGKPGLIVDPRRIERAYQFTAGLKGVQRLFLMPSLVYSFGSHSIQYPSQPQLMSDRVNTHNTIHLLASSVKDFPLSYDGSFSIEWQQYDNLFDRSSVHVTNADSFKAVLDIHSAYQVSMFHRVSKYFANGIGVEYLYDISRMSTMYNAPYVDLHSDRDIIIGRQRLTVVPVPQAWGIATMYYEYSDNLTNLIRKEESGRSTADRIYRVGDTYKNTVFGRCTLSEISSAEVRMERYLFTSVNRGNPPPYIRMWTSLVHASVPVSKQIDLQTDWSETYRDQGKWYGIEYLDTVELKSMQNISTYQAYYGIDSKDWNHFVLLTLLDRLPYNMIVRTGCGYHIFDDRMYDAATHSYMSAGFAHSIFSPFCGVEYTNNKNVNMKISVTYNNDGMRHYWDAAVSLNGTF